MPTVEPLAWACTVGALGGRQAPPAPTVICTSLDGLLGTAGPERVHAGEVGPRGDALHRGLGGQRQRQNRHRLAGSHPGGQHQAVDAGRRAVAPRS